MPGRAGPTPSGIRSPRLIVALASVMALTLHGRHRLHAEGEVVGIGWDEGDDGESAGEFLQMTNVVVGGMIAEVVPRRTPTSPWLLPCRCPGSGRVHRAGEPPASDFNDRPEPLKPLVRQRRRCRDPCPGRTCAGAIVLVSGSYFQPSNRSKLPVDLFGRSS